MASIYKKPNSPYWYAQYRVRTATGWKLVRLSTKIKHTPATVTREVKEAAEAMGKQLNVLTREQAMTKAQRLADALESTARANLPAYQLRRAISALSTELTGESMEMPSVKLWLDDHMRRITRNGLKPASIANYKQAFDKFRASMGERINLPLDRITPLMLDDFKTIFFPVSHHLPPILLLRWFPRRSRRQLIIKLLKPTPLRRLPSLTRGKPSNGGNSNWKSLKR